MRSRNFTSTFVAPRFYVKYSFHSVMAMGRFRRVTSDVLAQPLHGVKELLMASLIPAAELAME